MSELRPRSRETLGKYHVNVRYRVWCQSAAGLADYEDRNSGIGCCRETARRRISKVPSLGKRDSDKRADWVKQHSKAQITTFAEAAKFGQIVVLAIKGTMWSALRAPGSAILAGQPVSDPTNPFTDTPPVDDVPEALTTLDDG